MYKMNALFSRAQDIGIDVLIDACAWNAIPPENRPEGFGAAVLYILYTVYYSLQYVNL